MSLTEQLLSLFVINQYIFLLWNLYRDSKHLNISVKNLLLNENTIKDIEDNYKILQELRLRLRILEDKKDKELHNEN